MPPALAVLGDCVRPLIHSFGAAGGFLAPNVRVWTSRLLDLPEAGIYALTATTVVGASTALLYLDLRIRLEGLDLAWAADRHLPP